MPGLAPTRPTLFKKVYGISSEKTKFYYMISQLDHQYAAEVEAIITPPPERDPYTTLKTELVTRLSPSKE
jgi:hypothetical protein